MLLNSSMKHIITLPLLFAMTGCGPLAIPAIQRLPPQDQQTVDTAWGNMLSPSDRLDRQTLLDVLTNYQLFHLDIDRLNYQSEKVMSLGRVVMTIRFDRADPSVDVFGFDLYDQKGVLVRSERYA